MYMGKNLDLLNFKTPIETKLINQEMKIRWLKKGIKVLTKNINTHQRKQWNLKRILIW